jgi:hypothetical protein
MTTCSASHPSATSPLGWMSQRQAEWESSETSASRRQRPGMVLYGKMVVKTATNRKCLSRERPWRTSGTTGRARATTPSTPPQMGMSAFPIPKPPTQSPSRFPLKPSLKCSLKCPPSRICRLPTILMLFVKWYYVAAGTMDYPKLFLTLQVMPGWSEWFL